MFLSRRAVYILVIDMSRGIDTVVMDDEPYFDCSGSKSLKIEGKYTVHTKLEIFEHLNV